MDDSRKNGVASGNMENSAHPSSNVRRQEQTRGGLSYEMIFEPESNSNLKKPKMLSKKISLDQIQQKLKAAEEKRLSLEQTRASQLSLRLAKIDETTRKKMENTNVFINHTKEALESKMDHHVEKREAIISGLKEKLKTHSAEVDRVRQKLTQQKSMMGLSHEDNTSLHCIEELRDEHVA